MKHARADYSHIQDPSGKIPENEPCFLLRGQDICAPEVVRFWAWLNEKRGGSKELSNQAVKLADDMDDWPIKKTADL